MGGCPSSLNELCGLGEGLQPGAMGDLLGGTVGIWGSGSCDMRHSVPMYPEIELCLYSC